jgi:hypothetical protein
MSTIIDEIKQARKLGLDEDKKQQILAYLKSRLTTSSYAVIDGAAHYQNDCWTFRPLYCRAPFSQHPAIADWLHTLGFHTSRFYNKGGVDNGLKVWID